MEAQARKLLDAISAHMPALAAWPEVKALREALGDAAGKPRCQAALDLAEREGLPLAEAARRVGVSPSAVTRARVRRAAVAALIASTTGTAST